MLPLSKKHQPQQQQRQRPSPSSFSLESVMRQYASQPDLLELILSSKVEEDRRRTEEAKLKRKELDYALISHQEEPYRSEPPTLSPSSSPSLSSTSSTCPPSPPMTLQPDLSPWSYPHNHYQPRQTIDWSSSVILPPLISDLSKPSFHPTPLKRPSTDSTSNQKRRRREMHAITAIVETKEFPYNDDYLWRNNGNTTHKKSGNKSIYYKCAKQGCPVNKTCTFRQDTGEYLIKYRGDHLPGCSTIQRIHEV